MAIKLADTARPNNYVDDEHLGTFPVAYAEDVWFEDGTRLSEKTFSGQSIQVNELPLASATEEGHVYQYLGATGTYTHGCFYECVEDVSMETYEWKVLSPVQNGVIYTDQDLHSSTDYPVGSVIVYTGEPQWEFFKGHHYKFVENETIVAYRGTVVLPSGSQAILDFKEKEIKVGNVIIHDNDDGSYYAFNIVAVDGNTITLNNGWVYTEVEITDNTRVFEHFTGWIDIGGGGSDGGTDYEEFIGTQAEWDALPQAQKNKYDGKIVNITDDESGMNVADTVAVNNMNPVTSNAVAQCTGYIDTIQLVGEPFDTTYQDGSSSQNYQITNDGLYKLHIYLSNPTAEKTKNRCLVQRYEDGSAKATLADYIHTGAGAIQMELYVRVKAGTIGVTHEASGGNVGGRCYFELLKVTESH